MAEVEQIDADAQYWLDCFSRARNGDEARRFLNAFLGELYRLYIATWPEAKSAKDRFFGEIRSNDQYLRLDVLTMYLRGSGVHDLTVNTEVQHGQLYPSANLFPGPYTVPGPQYHFPSRDPRMGRGVTHDRELLQDGYDRLIRGAPVLPTIYGALLAVRALSSKESASGAR